ncbi:MAG: thioredoxin family protein [Parvularculaceae bacterium]
MMRLSRILLLSVFAASVAGPAFARRHIMHVVDLTESAAAAVSEPHPFNEAADANADIEAALQRASRSDKLVLVVFGGNWCHDSRALAANFKEPRLSALLEARFETVWVDVGYKDKNLDVAKRFGISKIRGTPTVLVLSGDGAALNLSTAGDWDDAASKSLDETIAYFNNFKSAGA